MKGNNVTKRTSETPTVEMEDIDVPASPLENLSRTSEENMTDNPVRRQRVKTKDSVIPRIILRIRLNNWIVEATCRVERKSYPEVEINVKTLHPRSVQIFQILFQI